MASTSRIPRLVPSSLLSSNNLYTRRCFTTSRFTADHYQTLQIPRSATRQQIKAQFYRLSKEYHPDVKAGNEAKFKAVSEAYATLGNGDARQRYDSSFTSSSSHYGGPSYSSSSSSSSQPYYYQDIETGSTRRARANYAWEYTRRTNPRYNGRQNPFASSHGPFNPYSHGHNQEDSHFDRMQARAAWRASNLSSGMRRRMMDESEKIAKEESLRNTSGIGRAVQAMAMFFGVLWVAGSLRASAWEKEETDERSESGDSDTRGKTSKDALIEGGQIAILH